MAVSFSLEGNGYIVYLRAIPLLKMVFWRGWGHDTALLAFHWNTKIIP